MGIIFGIVSAKIFKHTHFRDGGSHHTHLELALLVSFAYFSYVVAESIYLSGIMSILFMGIMMDHYTKVNLSSSTKETSQSLFEMLSHIAESFVFVYLGMAVFTFAPHHLSWGNALLTLLWCLIVRFFILFPLVWISNMFRKRKIVYAQQLVLCLSGIRGAVTFALAIDASLEEETRSVFITTSLMIIFITTFVFGSVTYPTMSYLKVKESRLKAGKGKVFSIPNIDETRHWFVSKDMSHFKPYLCINGFQPGVELTTTEKEGKTIEEERENTENKS